MGRGSGQSPACFLAVFQVWVATLYNVCYDFFGMRVDCINLNGTVRATETDQEKSKGIRYRGG